MFFDREIVNAEIRSDPTEDVGTASRDKYRVRVTNKAKAVAFLKCANRKTYGKLLSSIREQYSFKIDVPYTLKLYRMPMRFYPLTHHTKAPKEGIKRETK